MNSSNNFLNPFITLVVSGLLTSNLFMSDLYSQSVGINTDGSVPTELLHVKGGKALFEGDNNIFIDPSGSAASGGIYGTSIKSRAGGWNLGSYAHSTEGISLGGFYINGGDDVVTKFVIGKPSAEKLTVLQTGFVGIGNNNPSYLLDLGTEGTTAGVIRLGAETSGNVILQPAATTNSYTLTLPSSAGTANQVIQTNGSGEMSWVTPATSEISVCEFLSTETVLNRASGLVTFVVPATMNGRRITKAIARSNSGAGTVSVSINKNGSAVTSISTVSSGSGVQSASLSNTVATGDLITITTASTSGTLNGLTVTITVQ